jgi:hypothetical protein
VAARARDARVRAAEGKRGVALVIEPIRREERLRRVAGSARTTFLPGGELGPVRGFMAGLAIGPGSRHEWETTDVRRGREQRRPRARRVAQFCVTCAARDGAMRAFECKAERIVLPGVDGRWPPLPGIMAVAAGPATAAGVGGEAILVGVGMARSAIRCDAQRHLGRA